MKTNLLLLHGAIGSKNQFSTLQAALENHVHVHVLNFDGHGGTETSEAFTMDLFSRNVLEWMEREGMEKISIFGYSMGGYVALNLALKHPEKVERIVTLGTKFNWTPETAEKESRMLNPAVIEEKVPKFAQKLAQDHAPADWKNVLNKTATMMKELGNGAALKTEDWKQIQHHVVIGIGTEDKMVTVEESREIAELLPNGRLVELEGVPHPIDQVEVGVLVDYIVKEIGSAG